MGGLKKLLKSPEILIWIVAFAILIPVLKPGFFSVHDETHIVDVYQMIRSLDYGGFPPRFAPDFNFGLGHPYFNFYYHLPFYITTLFYYLGFTMTDSFKYMMGIAVIGAASGFYFFLRNHTGQIPAVVGTLVYILSPYFAVDLYVRGAFGELFIFALFPWCAFFLKRFLDKPYPSNLGLAAVSLGLLGISHNVMHPFVFTLLFFYGLVCLVGSKSHYKKYLLLFVPFIAGVGLSAYYLIPAFFEVKFISSYEQINIADHFPFIKQLLIPNWGYGPSIWGPLDDISFNIGTVNLLAVLCSLLVFKYVSREEKLMLIFFLAATGVAVVLTNNRTLFFWESLQFLRLVQFPWRMLLIITIATSFISAIVIESLYEKLGEKRASVITFLVVVLLIVLNLWHYRPSEYKQVTDEQYLERYFANRTLKNDGVRGYLSPEYLNFTEDFIPPTAWQKARPRNIMPKARFASGAGSLNYLVSGSFYDISYSTPVTEEIVVAKTYFPGWEAEGNSGKIDVKPYSEFGMISVPVEAGSGNIKLEFKDTVIRKLANTISASAAIMVALLFAYPVSRKIKLVKK
jgi:hypothetical protein